MERSVETPRVRRPMPARREPRTVERDRDATQGLAQALGWFSVGLGLAQIIAPGGVARLIGAEANDHNERLMRTFGMRELSAGIGILSGRHSDKWVRARVAGDMLDLAALGKTLASTEERGRTIAATVAVLGVTALDLLAAKRMATTPTRSDSMEGTESENVQHVRRAITINKSPEEVAAFWREHSNGEDALDESVRFVPAPGGRGTEVHLDRTYKSPGRIARVIKLVRHDDPSQHVFDELFALKQIIETGETVISDAWVNGPGRMHPAQPDAGAPERAD